MNIILGSGIIGLLAKLILGQDWKIIPFYRSRYFSFNPALDDNFIIRDEKLDSFVNDMMGQLNVPVYMYKRVWSINGQLVSQFDKELCHSWMYKIFGQELPSQSQVYFADRMNLFVYDIRINQLYQNLCNQYISELQIENSEGQVTEIGDHYLIRGGKRLDFDNAISTIPLDSLLKLIGVTHSLQAKTVHYLHVETENLDFEGANQMLVVDQLIDFFKVTNIAPNRYLFYCNNNIQNPGNYLMQFMRQFDILDGTSIDGTIPIGLIPKIDIVEKNGVFCVGSSAQWDWCMDVSSCILRLLRYSQRGHKPFQPTEIKF